MSDNKKSNSNGHEKIEKNVGLMAVLIAVAISFGGLAQICLLYTSRCVEETGPKRQPARK